MSTFKVCIIVNAEEMANLAIDYGEHFDSISKIEEEEKTPTGVRRKKIRDPELVKRIERAKGSDVEVGRRFGVSSSTVNRIRNGQHKLQREAK